MSFEIVDLTDVFGVEVKGVDLSQPVSPEDAAALRALFFAQHLLLFREQDISIEGQQAFMSIINKVIYEPEISLEASLNVPMERRFDLVSNTRALYANSATELAFHSDYMYTPHGALQALSLWGDVIEQHSPTTFANMVNAVRRLPAELRDSARKLVGDNLLIFAEGGYPVGRDRMSSRPAGDPNSLWPHSHHPVISRHPVTGAEYLNVSEWMTSHIVGWNDAQSEPFLSELTSYAYAPENTYTHNWRTHDLVVWDNIGLQHRREAYPGEGERTLRRVVANPNELCEHVQYAETDDWVPSRSYSGDGAARFENGTWVYN